MDLRKCLATGLWIALAMTADAMALSDDPGQLRFSAASSITEAPGQGSASEVQGTCGEEARYWTYGSGHWAVYQRLANRSEAESPTRPDFSGDWALNADASDDPLEKAKEAMQASARGGGSGGMGRGGRGGMGRGGMDGGIGQGGMEGGRQGRRNTGGGVNFGKLAALLAPAQELNVSHQDPMLLIVDENDHRQRIFTDFRGASVSTSGGLQQRVSVAGWEGTALVVETTMLGIKLIQNYHIEGETGQLVISASAQVSESQRVSYRLVYDRRKPEAKENRAHHNGGAAADDV